MLTGTESGSSTGTGGDDGELIERSFLRTNSLL